jgi:predicted YcjX-like family ATPase
MTTTAKLSESNFASLAEMMSAYAEQAVQLAWKDHRQRLDLSELSIDVLEQILDGQSAEDLEFQSLPSTRAGVFPPFLPWWFRAADSTLS